MMLARNHIVITGTGRAGTTLLVEILTLCGLDTGFKPSDFTSKRKKNSISLGGLEHDIRDPDCPYVVKSPWFCDYALEVLMELEGVIVDHIFVPFRDLEAAAESRRAVTRAGTKDGGLWHTDLMEPGAQEIALLNQIYKLFYAVSLSTVPMTLINFPGLAQNPMYLFYKLRMVLPVSVDYNTFKDIFQKLVDPGLIAATDKERAM